MSTNDNYDPEKEKKQHEEVAAGAAAAGTALGCLGFALMPLSFIVLVFILLGVVWFFFGHH